MTVFYDSHGWPWNACEGSDPDAQAFGPTGIAKRNDNAPTWGNATRAGLIIADPHGDGLDYLRDCPIILIGSCDYAPGNHTGALASSLQRYFKLGFNAEQAAETIREEIAAGATEGIVTGPTFEFGTNQGKTWEVPWQLLAL